ncbi:hypothetical protein, partial [Actinotalea sp. JY-7885]
GLPARRGVPSPPRVEVLLDGAVPGSVVRIAAALVVVGVVVLVTGGRTVGVVLGAVAAAGVLWRPAWPVVPVVVLLAGFVVLAGPDLLAAPRPGETPGLWRAAALVLGCHVALRLTELASRIAWRGVVDLALLAAVGRSVLGVQLVVQGALLAVVWLRSGPVGAQAGQGWLRVLAVVAVVGVTLLVVPRGWLRDGWRRGED